MSSSAGISKLLLALRVSCSAVWIAGTCALLVPPVVGWFSTPESFRIPETPVDRTNALYAQEWLLLQQTKEIIPPGQSYTVIAGDKNEEMLLFMLSLGVLLDRPAMPTTYWRIPQPEQGDRARYVVSFGCVEPAGRKRLVRRTTNGCIWEELGEFP